MAITTQDGLISAFDSARQTFPIACPPYAVATNAQLLNFACAQLTGGAMAVPTVKGSGGNIPTSTSAGALINFTNGGGTPNYLAGMGSLVNTITTGQGYALYDRVYAASGFDGTVSTPQTITSPPTLTRPGSTGVGLQIFLEIYTPIGITGRNITVQYTNSAGTASRNTQTYAWSSSSGNTAGAVIPVLLQAGDLGVQSIQSVTLSGSTGTAGNFGVALYLPLSTGLKSVADRNICLGGFASLGLPRVLDNAFIALVASGAGANTTGTGLVGYLTMVQG